MRRALHKLGASALCGSLLTCAPAAAAEATPRADRLEKLETATLIDAIDANRLLVTRESQIEIVRLLGTVAPTFGDGSQKPECLALEAQAFVRRIPSGSRLTLEVDRTFGDRDSQRVIWRHVYLDSEPYDLGREMIRQGLAIVHPEISFRRRTEFESLQVRAQNLGVGLWSRCVDRHDRLSTPQLGLRPLSADSARVLSELERRQARPPPPPQRAVPPPRQPPSRPSRQPSRRSGCCRICTKGIACGNSCISASKTCRRPPGCACNG